MDNIDQPLVGTANTYASQVADATDIGIMQKTGQFMATLPGAVAADAYNSTGAIIKFFGADGWNTDEHALIDRFDLFGTGAAGYYDAHKGLVDGAELVATSLIPGTLGIKALRAAQAGTGGARIAGALGMGDFLGPVALKTARDAASLKAAQISGVWNSMTGELGKAIAIGAGANILDMGAFGAAALVATNASPLYAGMSATDLAKNWAEDSLIFGAVGTAFSAAKTIWGLRSAAVTADIKALKTGKIDTGADSAPVGLRISQTMQSYKEALDAGTVSPETTKAVHNTLVSLAQSIIPEADVGARKSITLFTQKFMETPTNGVALDVEASNFFAKLVDIRRSNKLELSPNELPFDSSTGAIYKGTAAAPVHLGDITKAASTFKVGDAGTLKLDMGHGQPTKIFEAAGYDSGSLLNTQAAYLRAASLRNIDADITVSLKNLPIAERALQEARFAEANGYVHKFTFSDANGNAITDLDIVTDLLKRAKIDAVAELAADPIKYTPESIAATLNVSTKFLDNPGTEQLSLYRMIGSNPPIKEFLENPRTLIAKYDIGTRNVGKRGNTKANSFASNKETWSASNTTENIFDRTKQGNIYNERLVTSPVERPFSGTMLDKTVDAALETFTMTGDALNHIAANAGDFEKSLINAILPIVKDIPFKVNLAGKAIKSSDAKILNGAHGFFRYTPGSTETGEIFVNGAWVGTGQGVNYQTVTHEALHAATSKTITAVEYGTETRPEIVAAVADLRELLKSVKSQWSAEAINKPSYAAVMRKSTMAPALKDMHELITYGFVDADFQDLLRGLKGIKNTNAWTSFTDGIRDMFGLSARHSSALADLIDITDRIAQLGDRTNLMSRSDLINSENVANTAIYEQQAKQYIDNAMQAHSALRHLVSNYLIPEVNDAVLPTEKELKETLNRVSRTDSGASLFASANGGYNSTESFMQKIGLFTKRQGDDAAKKTAAQIGNAAHQLANDTELASEFQLLLTKLRSSPANYVLDPANESRLIRQDLAVNKLKLDNAKASGNASAKLADKMDGDEFIKVSDKLMREVLTQHCELNNARLDKKILVDNTMMPGSSNNEARMYGLSPVYHMPVNTDRTGHFLFVSDKSMLVGNGSTPSMILAKDAEALAQKRATIEQAYPGRFDFHSKGDTAEYYRIMGEYRYQRGMNDSFVDSSMRRLGVLSDLTPAIGTDGSVARKLALQLAEDFQGFHQRAAVREVRDAVNIRYADVFEQLKFLGKQYTDLATSKMAPSRATLLNNANVKNPYANLINMALDKSNSQDAPMWQAANAWIERFGDGAFNAVNKTWSAIADSSLKGERLDAEVAKLNKLSAQVGLEPLYSKMAVAQFGDQLPMRPVLRSFITRAQGVLNGLMLGFDPMQAVNNGLGQILFASEFKSLLSKIQAGDAGAGALKDILRLEIPGQSTPTFMNSAIKLHAKASGGFISGGNFIDYSTGVRREFTRQELLAQYRGHGILTNLSTQYSQAIDDLTMTSKLPTDAVLGERWDSLLDKGRSLTGNKLAEEYVRFVACHAARLLTDAAFERGLITSEAAASTYWNTAVNRMHGINVASQRAMIFHGAIGHSIGMFMTFQHNLFQQLFRYAGTGDTPAMAALTASQLGLYGIQGLPAFNTVSTHIIGNAHGNTQHTDPYTYIARNADMQLPGNSTAAEWILYGAGSNALGLVHPDLKMNIYSRGDINPRELTLFPSSVQNTVMYSATTSVVKNMLDVAGNIANGADARNALIHGLEHNGLNRPLAGLGAVLAGQQTTQSGMAIGSIDANAMGGFLDKFTFANFVRIAGAKPLDDAAAADSMYRIAAYQAKTTSDIRALAESLRIDVQGNKVPDAETMEHFMNEYAKRGGNMASFRGFVTNAYKTANTNQVIALAQKMQSPNGKQVAAVLGATNDRAWLQLMNSGNSQGNLE